MYFVASILQEVNILPVVIEDFGVPELIPISSGTEMNSLVGILEHTQPDQNILGSASGEIDPVTNSSGPIAIVMRLHILQPCTPHARQANASLKSRNLEVTHHSASGLLVQNDSDLVPGSLNRLAVSIESHTRG